MKFKDSNLLKLCLPGASHRAFPGFYQRVAVFLFFLPDVFSLTEQGFQFPPTGTAGSNQKGPLRTDSDV